MPVFISYSHQDREFVDQLAAQLVQYKVNVWLDRWELHVGDSLTSRIQEALTDASALLVVLSPASVNSDWFKRELNAGLVRELDERRVVVLPVLKVDCEIPLFLRDKLYADFRTNPDDGLRAVLESLARVINEWQGRVDVPEWYMDWSVDWGTVDIFDRLEIEENTSTAFTRITIVEQAAEQPYSVLSEIKIYHVDDDMIDASLAREMFQALAHAVTDDAKWSVRLTDQFKQTRQLEVTRPRDDAQLTVVITARRLGEDTGRDIIFHVGQQIQQIARQMSEAAIVRE